MTKNVYDVLTERGILKQASHPEEIRELLGKEKVTFYIGFDPTADSLHIGHYVPLIVMAHMQRAGHKPIALLGGGTAMVGDPSGKTEMRRMLTVEELDYNAARFKAQMSRIIDFSDDKAILVNNAEWIRSLNFLDFMRDIGVHFSVNHMLAAECYKQRLETGLSFFEMSYMLMQSYDFLVLNRKYGCTFQVGGDDQWSNMLGGMDLIRKKGAQKRLLLHNSTFDHKRRQEDGQNRKRCALA
jgi:tyrosyl-tRNA synthetase